MCCFSLKIGRKIHTGHFGGPFIHRHFDGTQIRQIRFLLQFVICYLYHKLYGRRRTMGRQSDYGNGMFQQLQEIMGRLDSVEKELFTEKIHHRKDVENLNAKIDGLTLENQLLRDDNARLRGIINNDSSNSSLPPSTDQKGGRPANTYNSRTKTGRKAGGQKGRKGTTLTKADVEEKIRSGKCRHEIRTVGSKTSGKYITKYVIDLKTETVITEVRIYADERGKFHIPAQYHSDVTYGENVKASAVALYSEGVMANDRIAAFLNSIGGDALGLSEGSVYGFCKKFSQNSEESILHLENSLLNQSVVATDATSITVNGKQNYIRNFSTEETVVYRAVNSKSIKALKKIRFLSGYAGLLLHDHETALYHFGTGHAECNVHIIRYLRKNSEETKNRWSGELIALLNEMNEARKQRISEGENGFSEEQIKAYEKKYHELIARGREENHTTAHQYAKREEKTLLNRLEKYSRSHLLFLYDFSVPFENNMSERDLRKAKNRQKMAGGFRKGSGQEMYCSILTIVETLKRRKMGIIENIRQLFMGTPAIF